MPGTGKTVTTVEIIQDLKRKRETNEANSYHNFKFVKINGMSLTFPQHVYTILCQEILNKKCRPSTATLLLENYFTNNRKKCRLPIVLLLDELDALITKKQTLLYNLFNWPAAENARLIIIAIANTMDLPERFLGKIRSRIGEKRLVYQPYNAQQIKIILESRLKGDGEVFSVDALRCVAEKVSSVSGDFRRALQVCKRAIEICKFEYLNNQTQFLVNVHEKIQFEHIMKAFGELFTLKTLEVSFT